MSRKTFFWPLRNNAPRKNNNQMNPLEYNQNSPDLTEEQMQFLEEELEGYRKNPEDVISWEEIKTRMTNQVK